MHFAPRISRLLLAAALVFGMTALTPDASHAEAIVGQPAPAFTLTDWNGTERSLAEMRGKYVVLEWFNPECPYVKKHYNTGNMQSLQQKHTADGAEWFVVNSSAAGRQGHVTAAEAHEIMTKWKGAPTAVLLDHEGETGKAYGATATPHMFVIDPNGVLIYAGAIDDNDSVKESTVASARNHVTAALEESKAGKPVTVASSQAYGCAIKYAS